MSNLYKFVINGVNIYVSAGSPASAADKVNQKFYPVTNVSENDAQWCPHFIQ